MSRPHTTRPHIPFDLAKTKLRSLVEDKLERLKSLTAGYQDLLGLVDKDQEPSALLEDCDPELAVLVAATTWELATEIAYANSQAATQAADSVREAAYVATDAAAEAYSTCMNPE